MIRLLSFIKLAEKYAASDNSLWELASSTTGEVCSEITGEMGEHSGGGLFDLSREFCGVYSLYFPFMLVKFVGRCSKTKVNGHGYERVHNQKGFKFVWRH